MNAVEIKNVDHVYPSTKRSKTPRTVLSQFNLNIQEGEIFGLLGPNGGGKTTLFRILSTALTPTSGTVSIFNQDVVQQSADVRRSLGIIFQHPSLDKKLTLRENLVHQGHLYGLTGASLVNRIEILTARFKLSDRMSDLVETLSGGLARRGEIAKGLLHKPRLLLMDEPSTGLDPGARREMWIYLNELKKEGVTILLTTHLMEEGEYCDRLAILNQGHLVAMGTPAELKEKIGGDVITVQTKDPALLAQQVREKFGDTATLLNETLRIEKKEGHKFIPQLVEAFPGLIQSIKVGKPTLEDVFAHETGEGFWQNATGNENE